MKYANYQNTLSLHMIYTGHCEVGKEWCYRNIISPFTRLYLIDKGTANVYMNRICNRLLLNILQVISQKYGLNL